MQDLLGLGEESRMNYPGTVGGNWLWRMLPQNLDAVARRAVRILNRRHHRGQLPTFDAKDLVARADELVVSRYHVALEDASAVQLHEALSDAVMLRIAPRWADDAADRLDRRHALYLSAEYLVGRLVYNNLYALGMLEDVCALLAQRGVDLAALEDIEDAALGNGGLGAAGRVLPRQRRHAQRPAGRLRPAVSLRPVQAGVRELPSEGAAGRLDAVRRPVEHPAATN